jgi:mannitol 2-dehydrogenase
MGDVQGIPLRADRLSEIGARVAVPEYDRAGLTTGIVHIGVGAFHRAHQALAVDRLLRQGLGRDWAICGVGVLPSDAVMRDALRPQSGLYTLVEKAPDGTWDPRVIGAITEYLFAPDDPEAVLEKLADPATRIVSLTVTEGGYNFNQTTGEFMAETPAVAADLARGAVPTTFFGLIVEGLARRRARGIPAFTIMSCDNIQGNGHVAHRVFGAFARLKDPALADWMEANVRFPNSMVDRITPATTDADRAEVLRRFGIEDAWPVVCEPFFQWVLEDSFGDGRPPYEQAGVQIVEHVEPYELMKLRLLNAGHQGLAYPGHLMGYRLVHEAAQDPLIARYLLRYMEEEATPTLRPVPGIDLDAYRHELIARFSNAQVRDTIARLAFDASDRIPKFLVPVIQERLAAKQPVPLSAAIVATWARYQEGVDEAGAPIHVEDPREPELTAAARRYAEDPLAFVRIRELFGDIADDPLFTEPYLAALDSLHRIGARATLEALVAS